MPTAASRGRGPTLPIACAVSPETGARDVGDRMLEGRDSDSPILRRRLYGRSRGKALRAGQERLLKEALPHVAIAPEALVSGSLFPFEPRELWLEIGFGSGEHLIAQAKSNPEVGFIGCEPFLNGDRKSTRLNSSHVAISYAV